jgi:hypothetical protein
MPALIAFSQSLEVELILKFDDRRAEASLWMSTEGLLGYCTICWMKGSKANARMVIAAPSEASGRARRENNSIAEPRGPRLAAS